MDRNGDHDDPVLTAMPPGRGKQRLRTGIDVEDLKHPVVCEALALWQGLCGERRMPPRSKVTPRMLRGFLKYAALIEVIDDGRDYRFRVSGDAVNQQQGMPLQGMTIADIDAHAPGYGSHLKRVYGRLLRRREPLAYRGIYFRPTDRHTFSHECVMLPLGEDGETMDHFLLVSVDAAEH